MKQRDGLLGILLGTYCESLLRKMLSGIGINISSDGLHRAGQDF